jgi:hypothetical protein
MSSGTRTTRIGPARLLAKCAVAVALFLAVAGTTARAQCPGTCNSPNLCNKVKSETVLPPDKVATVYVTLRSSCGGVVTKSCTSSFPIGNALWTKEQKCQALVTAITGNAACTAAGYTITSNTCAADRKFTASDLTCGGSLLSLGISNDPDIFSQAIAGQPIPDYEAELITPGCTDVDSSSGNGNDIENQVTLGGTSNGVPIAPAEPAHVEMIVDLTPNGGIVHTAEVITGPISPTIPVMSAESIASLLAAQLRTQGVPGVECVGRNIRVSQPHPGNPIGVGIGTSDEGIVTDTQVVESDPGAGAIPTLSTWGMILLVSLMGGTAFWILRRRTRSATDTASA